MLLRTPDEHHPATFRPELLKQVGTQRGAHFVKCVGRRAELPIRGVCMAWALGLPCRHALRTTM